MNLIVAVDKNWAIGKENKLLYNIPGDLEYFKRTTIGKVVVMGGNTFLSLPNGALGDRVNIVISPHEKIIDTNAIICDTIEQLFTEMNKYSLEDVFIIGGQMLYQTMLPHCKKAYITKIDAGTNDADCFFPNLDEMGEWKLTETSEKQSSNGFTFSFCIYERQ